MNYTINDPRDLRVFICQPSNGQCYNWDNGNWEVFNQNTHLKKIPSVPGLPSVLSSFKNVYLQDVFENNPDAVGVVVVVDASGNITGMP